MVTDEPRSSFLASELFTLMACAYSRTRARLRARTHAFAHDCVADPMNYRGGGLRFAPAVRASRIILSDARTKLLFDGRRTPSRFGRAVIPANARRHGPRMLGFLGYTLHNMGVPISARSVLRSRAAMRHAGQKCDRIDDPPR